MKNKIGVTLLAVVAYVLMTASTASGAIGIDQIVFKDQTSKSTSVTTPAFSTTGTDELLLAMVSADVSSASGTNNSVTSITGAGLTWVLVRRTNTQRGTAEIWRAFATTQLTNVTVKANLTTNNVSSITVMTFQGVNTSGTNGSGAIGSTASGSGTTGSPAASLVTTASNSLIVGVGEDWNAAPSVTAGSNQTVIHQVALPNLATFWSQQLNTTTPASGTVVTINDTVPTNHMYNMAICEILASVSIPSAPTITSLNNATFVVGSLGSFPVTATGSPASTFSEAGALPAGVTFTAAGVLGGTPAAGSVGTYPLTITAQNGVLPNATQNFTLTVKQAPAITSLNNATFNTGSLGSFTVTATGSPAPTLSETGVLPAGVTFDPVSGVLGGTPTTSGNFPITFTAQNGVLPNATQNFTLTVNGPPAAPAITSANSTTFVVASAGTFTVTATGSPASTFSEAGALPAGVTFTAGGVLSGTPAAGTAGTYPLTITAQNGVSPNATQSFTLTINQRPAITSGNSTTFTAGTAGSFTVTATGSPAPTFSQTGPLPSGVTFTAGGILSGTPAAGAAGIYPLTLTAQNGVLPNATQSFTLTVNPPPTAPTISSSSSTTFLVGSVASFTVTATGSPASTFSRTGTLPAGVTFTAAGLLGGTPAAGTEGIYPLTITAQNGVLPNATQNFTLTVNVPVSACNPPTANDIVCENSKPGTSESIWGVNGYGDDTIQGFATDISVNRGQTVSFKVKTTASAYRLDIFRLGYYGGNGARLITTINPSVSLPQSQPACLTNASTRIYDCGNWAVSASWAIPSNATSGIYFAHLVRTDTGGDSQIFFIVRNDASHSDIVYQTSDTSWQAYNAYGGNSLYGTISGTWDADSRAYKVSYNRPFNTFEAITWIFGAEYPMIRWLEANGFDVTYSTDVDSDRNGSLIRNHKLFMSTGHDEYWSGGQRTNVEAARDAGVNLAFFSGNEVFWKTRWENSIDGSGTPYRTLVCYKETLASAKIDPTSAWTGTWRDPRFSPPADGGRPENSLTGTFFMINGPNADNNGGLSIKVPAADGKMRFWRNTSIANLSSGSATLPRGTLGYEWDLADDNGSRPAGLFYLSTTTQTLTTSLLLDYGATYGAGTATHHLTLYRAPSGALVFGAGTVQWSWGLDSDHDNTFGFANPSSSTDMRQATINLFADMGIQPATIQSGLLLATKSTDSTPPASTITSPAAGASLTVGTTITISGSASDAGGVVGGVEISVNGGQTWRPANGRAIWTYSFKPTQAGSYTLRSRAVDDSGNIETPGAGITVSAH